MMAVGGWWLVKGGLRQWLFTRAPHFGYPFSPYLAPCLFVLLSIGTASHSFTFMNIIFLACAIHTSMRFSAPGDGCMKYAPMF